MPGSSGWTYDRPTREGRLPETERSQIPGALHLDWASNVQADAPCNFKMRGTELKGFGASGASAT